MVAVGNDPFASGGKKIFLIIFLAMSARSSAMAASVLAHRFSAEPSGSSVIWIGFYF
jgi:hypothetical protein